MDVEITLCAGWEGLEKYRCRQNMSIDLYLWTKDATGGRKYFDHKFLLEIYSRVFTKANVFYVDDSMILVTEIGK